MKKITCTFCSLILLGISYLSNAQNATIDSLSYAFGVFYGKTLIENEVLQINPEYFMQGLSDAYKGANSPVSKDEAANFINNYFMKLSQAIATKNLEDGRKFLESNKLNKDVQVHASGLQYKVVRKGSGIKPKSTDRVTVHYRGTHLNGDVFDSSYDRGESISFNVDKVIKGWTIGLQLMEEGAKYIFYIPSELAYGSQMHKGSPIQPNEVLIFEVELFKVETANN